MSDTDVSSVPIPQHVRDEVVAWLREHAHPLTTVDPDAPLDDLAAALPSFENATVVGLGEAIRGVRTGHELFRLKHRLARLLVERAGFRVIALEDAPAATATLDEHVRPGGAEAADPLAASWTALRTTEFLDLVRWARRYNTRHPDDPVRFVGCDGPEPQALAHNILSSLNDERSIVYWGGIGHSAVDAGGEPNEGAVLRANLGARYVSVGVTCHHGVGDEVLPPPPNHFVDSVLGAVGVERYLVELRDDPRNAAVRTWLDSPTSTRVIGPHYDPEHDGDFALIGGTPREWFDVLVHVRGVTPARYLPL